MKYVILENGAIRREGRGKLDKKIVWSGDVELADVKATKAKMFLKTFWFPKEGRLVMKNSPACKVPSDALFAHTDIVEATEFRIAEALRRKKSRQAREPWRRKAKRLKILTIRAAPMFKEYARKIYEKHLEQKPA